MDSNTTKLHPQNLRNNHPHDFDWPYQEDLLIPFDHIALDELPSLDIDGFFDVNNSLSLPFHWDDVSELDTDIFSFPPLVYDQDMVVDEIKPVRMIKLKDDDHEMTRDKELQEVTTMIARGFSSWKDEEKEDDEEDKRLRSLRNNGRRSSKSSVLGLEEIQKHFHIPISAAAKEMNVGLTVLKKRCRELNIMRWPHRKLKSLKSLIQNIKEMGLTNEIKGLEEHKRLVEELPDMDLTLRTKRLRQACFKANYKKKRIRFNNNIAAALH